MSVKRDYSALLFESLRNRFGPCQWTQEENPDYGIWETECGHSFVLDEGNPKENEMNYCPFCGRPLKQKLLSELFDTEEE